MTLDFLRVWFANETEEEESFQDTNSGINYDNHSKHEVLDHAARFQEQGHDTDIRTVDYRDMGSVPDEARFNTAIFEVDQNGFYFPSEYDPGNPRNPSNQP